MLSTPYDKTSSRSRFTSCRKLLICLTSIVVFICSVLLSWFRLEGRVIAVSMVIVDFIFSGCHQSLNARLII